MTSRNRRMRNPGGRRRTSSAIAPVSAGRNWKTAREAPLQSPETKRRETQDYSKSKPLMAKRTPIRAHWVDTFSKLRTEEDGYIFNSSVCFHPFQSTKNGPLHNRSSKHRSHSSSGHTKTPCGLARVVLVATWTDTRVIPGRRDTHITSATTECSNHVCTR